MSLIDSHCHIPLLCQDIPIQDILSQARANDVGHMLCVAIDLAGSPAIIQLAKTHEMISASVGVHPNTVLADNHIINELRVLGNSNAVVAIGETGLDYFRNQNNLEQQQDRFRLHINVAKDLKKPLIIHTRNAKDDVLKILKEEGADIVGGVMHCFVEDWDTAQAAIDLNFMISFSGIVTFKNAKALQEVAKQVPLEQMLIETDSPYLAPVPFRGKINQPAYLRYIAEFIATLKQVNYDIITTKTTENYHNKFN